MQFRPPADIPSKISSTMLMCSQIRFLGDPTAKFTEALGLLFDGSATFGGPRSKRYALEIEDGKVKAMHVEPDNTGVNGECCSHMLITGRR